MSRFKLIAIIMILAMGILGTACAALPADGGASSGGGGTETITLVANPWPASELNVAVAKILIESELGNPVEIVSLDENAQWDALAAGDIDASLEVWPSGHGERIVEYIENLGTVEDGGALGPKGEIGWYVPTYAVDANPALATWEGFADAAADFASAETGDLGRFLGADPSWVQKDEEIIETLELPFQVVWTGSEEALLSEVSSSYSREEPVLFYFYSPHAIFEEFALTQVELPAYEDGCTGCAYPADELMKIFNAGLKEKDANVHTMLSNMNYGSDAQVAMLAALNGGMSADEAAQAWVDANGDVWQAWLP